MAGATENRQLFDSSFGRIATAWGHYVREGYRDRGWALKLNEKVSRNLRSKGFDVAVGPVLQSNAASMKTSEKIGAEHWANVMLVRLKGD